MSAATVGTLPHGARGFDCNQRVSLRDAAAFWDAGYRFVVRYVRRTTPHDYDLSTNEVLQLLKAGLGIMVVQHVAAEGWTPTQSLGTAYGETAADECRKLGMPKGVAVWCDLEGVSAHAPAVQIIQYCNAWFDAVRAQGYDPGLYVGYGCGLTGEQLYWKLKFRRFWAAYNLNEDSVPAVRGPCMYQGAYPRVLTDEQFAEKERQAEGLPPHKQPHRRVFGIAFEYDTDVIERDGFNNMPSLLLPGDPG